MNVSFKGTENNAGYCTIIADENPPIISHKVVCTLNNKDKKHLYDFGPILDEFKYSKDPAKNNKLVIEVKNKLSEKDITNIKTNRKAFKREFKPQGDYITINGKPIQKEKNQIYVFQKIQDLMQDIREQKDIKFLFHSADFSEKQTAFDLFEEVIDKKILKEQLKPCLSPEGVKYNADNIYKTAQNVIKTLISKK